MLEHGAYCLILDAYYEREQPLTKREAIRIARARTAEEEQAVELVLDEFFEFDPDTARYVQSRVEEELNKAAHKSEANKQNGKKGGRPRKQPKKSNVTPFKAKDKPNGAE